MNGAKSIPESPAMGIPAPEKRVILSMGGKGGVGKTCVMTGLAEWFQENSIPVKLLDLDTENKSRGIADALLRRSGAQGEHPHARRAGRVRR